MDLKMIGRWFLKGVVVTTASWLTKRALNRISIEMARKNEVREI